jgi:hypothetical protein
LPGLRGASGVRYGAGGEVGGNAIGVHDQHAVVCGFKAQDTSWLQHSGGQGRGITGRKTEPDQDVGKERPMGRTVGEIIESLPKDRQASIEDRFQELRQEVESLRQLRQIAGKVQADIAAALRGYVEAIGGELELIVRLPSRPPLRLQQLGDVFSAAAE